MKFAFLISIFALLGPSIALAQLTVWPGDANNNGVANHYDLLSVGLAFGSNGPSRNVQGNTWQASSASIWQSQTPGGTDLAYTDCDGNGFVNASDTAAIGQNFGLTHSVVVPDTFSPSSPSAPTLTLDFQQDSLVLTGDTLIQVNINVGDTINPVVDLHGLAFSVVFDSAVVDSVIFNLQGGFIASSGNALRMGRVRGNRVNLAITRTTQSTVVGFGTIGSIGIVMDDNLRTSQDFSLGLRVVDVYALDASESLLPMNGGGDSIKIQAVTVHRDEAGPELSIYPVPTHQILRVNSPVELNKINLYDVQGQLVHALLPEGRRQVQLDLGHLPDGIYLLHCHVDGALLRRKIIVQHR